jgi:mono/diheme cytochrome c family protein
MGTAMQIRKRKWLRGLLVALGIAGILAVVLWSHLFRKTPVHFASDEEHFKYASIGLEEPIGMPYWLWLVLPRIFPEKLPGPGGYASLGMVWEEGQEMPVGFTKTTIGFPRVGVNCAACHTTSVRKSPGDKPLLIPGGPAHQFDIQAYQRFLIACAKDPRFNADTILKEVAYLQKFSPVEKALYRYLIIPYTKKGLQEQEELFAWMNLRPKWGPGRTDMNPFKLMVLKLDDDRSVGNTDMMAIWNERAHEGFLRHTDGLNPTVIEASYSAALAAGATADSVDIPAVRRVNDWLMDLPSPAYPFPIDRALAARGRAVFSEACAACHEFGPSSRLGKLVPLAEIGTDRNRAEHWTKQAADEFNRQFDTFDWGFDHFQGSTGGYVALALDGIWARAPYLHNGSVPSLRDMLEPVENRPKTFYRGYDVFDPRNVGFVSDVPSRAGRQYFEYDTTLPGNGNGGHVFGTSLPAADKSALIEYLKTF